MNLSLINYKQPLVYLKNKVFAKPTYAQHEEDIVIQKIFGKIESFIDIGAYNGITCSNTFLFSLQGAKGLCFERTSYNFSRLQWLYSLNNKVECVCGGISNSENQVKICTEGILSYIPETQDPWGKENLSEYMSDEKVVETIDLKPLEYWLEKFPYFLHCDIEWIKNKC